MRLTSFRHLPNPLLAGVHRIRVRAQVHSLTSQRPPFAGPIRMIYSSGLLGNSVHVFPPGLGGTRIPSRAIRSSTHDRASREPSFPYVPMDLLKIYIPILPLPSRTASRVLHHHAPTTMSGSPGSRWGVVGQRTVARGHGPEVWAGQGGGAAGQGAARGGEWGHGRLEGEQGVPREGGWRVEEVERRGGVREARGKRKRARNELRGNRGGLKRTRGERRGTRTRGERRGRGRGGDGEGRRRERN